MEVRLVERLSSGYRLTPAGTAVLPALEAVAGATGATGQEAVRQALTKGYAVRALVRNEEAARQLFGERVQYAVGNVRDPAVKHRRIRSFERHIGAATHGNANISSCQGRGIIDSVPDLGNNSALSLQLAHNALLILRQKLGAGFDTESRCNRLCSALVVSGEHDGANAGVLERGEACLRVRPGFIAHGDQAGRSAID